MLEIRTFGGLRIMRDGSPVPRFTTRKMEALLVYLACQGRPCPREVLADLLWDGRSQTQAQANLRATLSRLHRQLPEALDITRHTVAIKHEAVWLDAAALEMDLRDSADPARTQAALALYVGEFLNGYSLRESRGFDDWLLLERERWHQGVVGALEHLVGVYRGREQYADALVQARRWLALDPLREAAHRQLMAVLALAGERGAALAQYESCCRVLLDELGLEPSAETTALSRQIERGELAPQPPRAMRGAARLVRRRVNPLPQAVGARYVGRAAQQAALRAALTGSARLVSLNGRGGVGKTALACRVLSDLEAEFDDEGLAGLVALTPATTSVRLDRVLTDMGRLLGPPAQALLEAVARDAQMPTDHKVSVLLDAVGSARGGRYILFLDNLETLQDPTTGRLTDPELQTLLEMTLAQSDRLCLFITSREALALPRALTTWEWRIALEEGLPLDEACRLLQAFDPAGTAGLRDAPEDQLRRLAEKTHGFPRALESVAGLLLESPLLRPDDLLNDNQLWLTEVTSAIVQHVIARLDPAAIRVLEALAIFGSPVPVAALEFLLAPYMETSGLRATLSRLVRAYFVHYDPATRNFTLHPIDQAYCASRVPSPASGGADAYNRSGLHRRAAQFFRHQRRPEAEWTSVEAIAPQLAEFEHLVAAEDYDAAAQLLLLIDRDYLWEWGQQGRLRTMHAQLQGRLADPRLARASRRRFAWTHWPDIAALQPLFEQNLESARHNGDRQAEADALDDLAQVQRFLTRMQPASELHEQALAIYRQFGDRRGEGDALGGAAAAYFGLGQLERALDYNQQALIIHRELNHEASTGFVLWSLAGIYRTVGQFEQAIACQETAIGVYREINAPRGLANNLSGLAQTWAMVGQFERAGDCLRQALDIFRTLQDGEGQAMVQLTRGFTLVLQGQAAEAAQVLLAVRAAGISNQVTLAITNHALISALIISGQLDQAQALLAISPLSPFAYFLPSKAALVGLLAARLGQREAAQAAFNLAIEQAAVRVGGPTGFHALFQRGLAQAGLAVLDQDDGRLQAAQADFAAAHAQCAAPGIVSLRRQMLEVLMACEGGPRLAPLWAVLNQASATWPASWLPPA